MMMQMCMGVALAFAVQMPAQAQLGGLVKKAKKVTGVVTGQDNGSNDAATAKAQADYAAAHPAVQERQNAEKAGGMDKYLGLDQTENGRILFCRSFRLLRLIYRSSSPLFRNSARTYCSKTGTVQE